MKQEARVILLPTKNNIKGAICQGVDRQLYPNASHPENKMYGNLHLYIVDDSEIKEGSIWINLDTNTLHTGNLFELANRASSCKKIIGTTDPELIKAGVPQMPQSFIEAYCKNPVEKVMVEYIGTCTNCSEQHEDSVLCMSMQNAEYDARVAPYTIKLTSDNELIIHLIEEKLYTRKEVINCIQQYWNKTHGEGTQNQRLINWIKENL